jgi:hypothetical protein
MTGRLLLGMDPYYGLQVLSSDVREKIYIRPGEIIATMGTHSYNVSSVGKIVYFLVPMCKGMSYG